ncbi:MAG: DUF362 domain-containing protein [Armatimonadetes bacterium]|nr:DUF362 domain-containing protein [Armatimonadota bacterium]
MIAVAIARSGFEPDEVAGATRRAMELAGGLSGRIAPGQRVLVKPNLVAPVHEAVTDKVVLSEVVRAVIELGATPMIGECPGFEYDSRVTLEFLGLWKLADELGVEAVNFEEEDYVRVPFEHPVVKWVKVARAAVECDAIINVPRMKCHKLTDVSLAIKNCFGMLEKPSRREIHAWGLNRGIAALYRLFRPALNVLDGLIIPMSGAVYGNYERLGVVAASSDMLALDLVAAELLGVSPTSVEHIVLASRWNGNLPSKVVGDEVEPIHRACAGKQWRRTAYRRIYQAIYAMDHCASRLGANSLIPWFHTRFGIRPSIDWSRCNFCGECPKVCPVNAIDLDKKKLDYGLCSKARCLYCIPICPQGAITEKQTFKM